VNGGVSLQVLEEILSNEFQCHIIPDGLADYPTLHWLRSVYNPNSRNLLLNGQLNERQIAYQLAKEIGFHELRLKERPYASNFVRVRSFEEVLNNYKAAYFAVAILVNRDSFIRDIGDFFAHSAWEPQKLVAFMKKYQASPEVLFQRFNVLTKDFGLDKVFFQRVVHDLDRDGFDMDKELHLNRRHQPHASGLGEHYCRRWLSITLLQDLHAQPDKTLLVGIQRAAFLASKEEYLCISLAKTGHPTPGKNVSVTLGVLLDDHAKNLIQFWNDPAIPVQTINVTCQRCAMPDCAERAAPPTVVLRKEDRRRMEELLNQLVK
jgi:predicted transcriptional regulator